MQAVSKNMGKEGILKKKTSRWHSVIFNRQEFVWRWNFFVSEHAVSHNSYFSIYTFTFFIQKPTLYKGSTQIFLVECQIYAGRICWNTKW